MPSKSAMLQLLEIYFYMFVFTEWYFLSPSIPARGDEDSEEKVGFEHGWPFMGGLTQARNYIMMLMMMRIRMRTAGRWTGRLLEEDWRRGSYSCVSPCFLCFLSPIDPFSSSPRALREPGDNSFHQILIQTQSTKWLSGFWLFQDALTWHFQLNPFVYIYSRQQTRRRQRGGRDSNDLRCSTTKYP